MSYWPLFNFMAFLSESPGLQLCVCIMGHTECSISLSHICLLQVFTFHWEMNPHFSGCSVKLHNSKYYHFPPNDSISQWGIELHSTTTLQIHFGFTAYKHFIKSAITASHSDIFFFSWNVKHNKHTVDSAKPYCDLQIAIPRSYYVFFFKTLKLIVPASWMLMVNNVLPMVKYTIY